MVQLSNVLEGGATHQQTQTLQRPPGRRLAAGSLLPLVPHTALSAYDDDDDDDDDDDEDDECNNNKHKQ
jgi:hypothetical protein